jgi:hypothetical protein
MAAWDLPWCILALLPIAICRGRQYGGARSPKHPPGGKLMATGAAGPDLITLTLAKSTKPVKQKSMNICRKQRKEDDPVFNPIEEVFAG